MNKVDPIQDSLSKIRSDPIRSDLLTALYSNFNILGSSSKVLKNPHPDTYYLISYLLVHTYIHTYIFSTTENCQPVEKMKMKMKMKVSMGYSFVLLVLVVCSNSIVLYKEIIIEVPTLPR